MIGKLISKKTGKVTQFIKRTLIAIIFLVSMPGCSSILIKEYDIDRTNMIIREGNGIVIGRIVGDFSDTNRLRIKFRGTVSAYTIDSQDGFLMLQMPPGELMNTLWFVHIGNTFPAYHCICFLDNPIKVKQGRTSVLPVFYRTGDVDLENPQTDVTVDMFQKKYPDLFNKYPVYLQNTE